MVTTDNLTLPKKPAIITDIYDEAKAAFPVTLEKLTDKVTLSESEIKRNELFYPVEMTTVQEKWGIQAISGKTHVIVVKPNTPEEKLVNVCAEGYNLKPLKDVIMPIENELRKYFDFTVNYHSTEDCRFFIDYILKPQHKVGTSKYDNMHPRIRIQHSYSGDVRYEMIFGFLRKVCSNGLHAIVYTGAGKKKHTSSLDQSMEANLEHMHQFIIEAEKYVKKYEVLYDTAVVNLEDRIVQVIEATSFPKTYADVIAERARFEMLAYQLPQTNWLVYNAFNYQLNHNENLKMQEQNRTKVDQNVLNFLINN